MKTGRLISALVAILLSGIAADSAHAIRKGASEPQQPSGHVHDHLVAVLERAGGGGRAGQRFPDRHRKGARHRRRYARDHHLARIRHGRRPIGQYLRLELHLAAERHELDGQNWAGSAVDHFSLTGNGQVHIVAGFISSITYSATTFTITPKTVIGDPLDFAHAQSPLRSAIADRRGFSAGPRDGRRPDDPTGYASRRRLPSPPLWPAPLPSGWATLTPRATRPAISTNSSLRC